MSNFAIHNTLERLMVITMAAYFFGVGGLDVLLGRRTARYIQEKHPDAWKALSIRSPYTLTYIMYVRNKGYLSLNDPELTRMFDSKRRFDTFTGVLFVALVGLLVFISRHRS